MKIKNALLLYKESSYKVFFLDRKISAKRGGGPIVAKQAERFMKADRCHYETLDVVTTELVSRKIRFSKVCRGQKIDYSKYDLIITVGGDGTFLDAARNCKKQMIVGINSEPEFSVGRHCVAQKDTFGRLLDKIISGTFRAVQYQRLQLKIPRKEVCVDALNDLLICHENPAVMFRYVLRVKKVTERQRSSGVWVSTAVGSSGAIKSAGGKLLNPSQKKMQYLPRELYCPNNYKYHLNGGVLDIKERIEFVSLMHRGMIYVDGAHVCFPFDYGDIATITRSPYPIHTIKV